MHRLKKIVKRTRTNIASFCGKDTRCYAVIKSKWIADCKRPFANLECIRIAKDQKRQWFGRIHLEQRKIRFFIGTNKNGLEIG